jgi:hypothetical protein
VTSVILDTILLDADIESLESSLDKIDSEVVLKCRTLYENSIPPRKKFVCKIKILEVQ